MEMTAHPVRVSTHVAFYAWKNLGRRRYQLDRLTWSDDHDYRLTDHPWPPGTDVEVRLNIFESNGRLYVGGVEVITAPEDIDTIYYGVAHAPSVEIRPVNTDLMRLVPLGALQQEALAYVTTEDAYDEARSELAEQPEALDRLVAAVSKENERPRRRASKLTPEILQIVARAHREGGGSPVRAVQRALDAAGYEGNGPAGETTWDQAAKAVHKARREGLLPPARRDTNRMERGRE